MLSLNSAILARHMTCSVFIILILQCSSIGSAASPHWFPSHYYSSIDMMCVFKLPGVGIQGYSESELFSVPTCAQCGLRKPTLVRFSTDCELFPLTVTWVPAVKKGKKKIIQEICFLTLSTSTHLIPAKISKTNKILMIYKTDKASLGAQVMLLLCERTWTFSNSAAFRDHRELKTAKSAEVGQMTSLTW